MPLVVEIHVGRGFGRGLLAIVEEVHLAVGPAEEQESASADIAGFGIDDLQREADRDGCVDSVAARLQNFDAHLRRLRLHRRHHAMRAVAGADHVVGIADHRRF